MVGAAGEVLVSQPAHKVGVEPTLPLQPLGIEHSLDQRTQILTHPGRNGHGKAPFLAVDDLSRQPGLYGTLQNILQSKVAHLERSRQAGSELNQSLIEEGSAE